MSNHDPPNATERKLPIDETRQDRHAGHKLH